MKLGLTALGPVGIFMRQRRSNERKCPGRMGSRKAPTQYPPVGAIVYRRLTRLL